MFLSVGQSMECLETLQTIKPEVYASTTANKSCCVIDEIRHMIDTNNWFILIHTDSFNDSMNESMNVRGIGPASQLRFEHLPGSALLSSYERHLGPSTILSNRVWPCLTLNLQVPLISARCLDCLEISDLEKASLNRRRATQYSPAKRYEIPRPQHSKLNLRLLPANLHSLAVYKRKLHTGIKWSGHRISAGPNLFMAKPQFSSCQDYPYDMNTTWMKQQPHFSPTFCAMADLHSMEAPASDVNSCKFLMIASICAGCMVQPTRPTWMTSVCL